MQHKLGRTIIRGIKMVLFLHITTQNTITEMPMKSHDNTERVLNKFAVLGSLMLFITLSLDVFHPSRAMDQLAKYMQLVVCIIFMVDFFIRRRNSDDRNLFWRQNWFLFFVSIPYLFIFSLWPIDLDKAGYYMLHLMPIIRGIYAVGVMVAWFSKSRTSTLFVTYLGAMLSLVYFASILFFEYEKGVNSYIHNYWEALWWACMDVTTVGSNIIAITTVGKLLSVALAAMGMMMFPIFTTFILSLYKKNDNS